MKPIIVSLLLLLALDNTRTHAMHDEAQKPSAKIMGTKDNFMLIEAAKNDSINKVQELLAAGANIKGADSYGRSALIWAAYKGHIRTIQLLIAAGADVNARDNFSHIPLSCAIDNNNMAMVQAFIAAGSAFPNSAPYTYFSEDIHKLFVASHTPFTPRNPQIKNAHYMLIHMQECAQLRELHKLIVQRKVYLQCVDPQGNTLLHNAILSGNRVMIYLLLYLMIKYQKLDALMYRTRITNLTPVEMAVARRGRWLLQPFFEIIKHYTYLK